jgi:hypothetical protein
MARLDRLSSVRRVAQIGAAIGRQFPYPLLQAVSRLDEDELQALVRSPQASVVLSGDIMHTPLQCAEPQLNSCFCIDAAMVGVQVGGP